MRAVLHCSGDLIYVNRCTILNFPVQFCRPLIADISKVDDVDYCFFASFQKIKTKTWSTSIPKEVEEKYISSYIIFYK